MLLSMLVITSCKKDLTELNVDPKSPYSFPSYAFFTNAQRTLASTATSPNVNLNIFRLIVQYWTETTYTDESNYDLQTRQIPRGVWNALYRDVLRDFQEARNLIPAEALDAITQKNELAIIDINEVYTWYYLVTTFGDIPYTDALNVDNAFPKYDDDKAIFTALLSRLDADIAALDISGGSFGNADIVYGGDPASWKKFAASMKLKIGMTLADADPGAAKAAVESAVTAGVFTSNDDNAVFQFLSGPPNTNPVWEDLVQSGRKDFVATNTIVDKLVELNDPRIPLYFTNDAGGDYSGGVPGESNNYATFSKPAVALTAPDFPTTLLSYSEVEFFLAEAIERGFTVGGTAADHYNNAVTASIVEAGGTITDASGYLSQPGVVYSSADYKAKIGLQKWISLYNRGWDEWIEQRRLDEPMIVAPASAVTDYPVRFTYSIDEQNINTANYNSASTAIGGDDVTTKLFWDVK